MAVGFLLTRYKLWAQAAGYSQRTIQAAELAVGMFDRFMDGIQNVTEVEADDFR